MGQYISPDLVKTCKICGEKFHPTARKQVCCNKEKTAVCVICGKVFTTICNTSRKRLTCSDACNKILIKQNQYKSSSDQLKQCEWCGEMFHPTSSRDKYCKNTHYQKCQVCGKMFEIDVRKDKTVKTCSKECRYKLAKLNTDTQSMVDNLRSTMLDKYGVDNAMRCPDFKDKAVTTTTAKYGVDAYTKTEEYKERVKQTSVSRYGTDHFLQSREVIDKRVATCLDRYGVDNASKSDGVKRKITKSFCDKYNVSNISQRNIADIEGWNLFKSDPRSYIAKNFNDKPTLHQIAEKLGVCITSVYTYLDLRNNSDLIARSYSTLEDEVVSILHDIDKTIKIKRNDRAVISPYEIDIYLPDYDLGIECNPTYTHNSTFDDPWGGPPKPRNYHQVKTTLCENKGIFLFHIFGYEWNNKKDIIVSMLNNLLGKNADRIYARNCRIIEVDSKSAREFLDKNHRQGYTASAIKLGLLYGDELVSVMTFGKMRATIGIDSGDTGECVELIRFCSKRNMSVVGGASRLFKYFVNTYHPSEIRSFSDRAHTRGTLYPSLGFQELRRSQPGYVWVDIMTDRACSRVSAQKHSIKSFLHDDNIDLSKSESDIMAEHGFVKVCDSGTITWQWLNKQS